MVRVRLKSRNYKVCSRLAVRGRALSLGAQGLFPASRGEKMMDSFVGGASGPRDQFLKLQPFIGDLVKVRVS